MRLFYNDHLKGLNYQIILKRMSCLRFHLSLMNLNFLKKQMNLNFLK